MPVTANSVRRTRKINATKYGRLLAASLPAVIRNSEEYDRANEKIKDLLKKGSDIGPEEDLLLDLLTYLVEKYDDEHYRIPDAASHEVIQFLMEQQDLRNKDLEPVLGSRGVTSDVINGRRKPSRRQIKALADFFKVSPQVFVSFD